MRWRGLQLSTCIGIVIRENKLDTSKSIGVGTGGPGGPCPPPTFLQPYIKKSPEKLLHIH